MPKNQNTERVLKQILIEFMRSSDADKISGKGCCSKSQYIKSNLLQIL